MSGCPLCHHATHDDRLQCGAPIYEAIITGPSRMPITDEIVGTCECRGIDDE